jgi:hypothetical protein
MTVTTAEWRSMPGRERAVPAADTPHRPAPRWLAAISVVSVRLVDIPPSS